MHSAKKLNDLWSDLDKLTAAAVGQCGHVIQKKIEFGELLIATKGEMEHGEWKRWVDDNCEFSYRTATRLMALAAKAKTHDLTSASGLTEAYRLAEILPEADSDNTKAGTTSQESYVAFAQRLEKALVKLPLIESWSRPDLETFIGRTRILAELHTKAVKRLCIIESEG